jgi:hypothetical protein
MAIQPSPQGSAQAEAKLQEALARLKAATERHAALVAVMSRTSGAPQERRLAQSQSRKIEQELRDAQRLVLEAQGHTR